VRAVRFLAVLAVVWVVWAGGAFLLQRRLLYPGTAMEPLRPRSASTLAGVESLWIEHDGGRVEAWYLPPIPPASSGPTAEPPPEPHPALLFFHGNGEFIDDWVELLRPFPERLGMGLLLVEYPGYGRSTGRPTEGSIVAVATAAWDRIAARPGVDPGRMVAMGRSLGGGPAAALAREREPAALVLQSAFTDVADLAVRRFWVPPFLVRDRFPVLPAVRAFPGPVLVLHGRRDEVIPFHHGEALAGAGPHVTFLPWACGHNDCPPPGEGWWEAVEDFLSRAGVLRGREG
jgi:hypothetical protein